MTSLSSLRPLGVVDFDFYRRWAGVCMRATIVVVVYVIDFDDDVR